MRRYTYSRERTVCNVHLLLLYVASTTAKELALHCKFTPEGVFGFNDQNHFQLGIFTKEKWIFIEIPCANTTREHINSIASEPFDIIKSNEIRRI